MSKPFQLAAALTALLLALTACGTSGEISPETTAPSTTASVSTTVETTAAPETIPPMSYAGSYDGDQITILRQVENAPVFAELSEIISAGEVIRDAGVEAALDIKLTHEYIEDMPGEVSRRIQSGERYDLLEFAAASDAASLAPRGFLADLGGLGLALEHPAYDHSLGEQLTVAGHTYFLFGAPTVADKAATAVLFLDCAAAEAAKLEIEMLLDEVRAGQWTVERLLAYGVDSRISFDSTAIVPLFLGSGGKIFDRAPDGTPILTTGETFSRAYAAMQRVMMTSAQMHENTVFTTGSLNDLEPGQIALPQPLVEAGEVYLSPVNPDEAGCIAVPGAPVNPTRTADLINAYFAESIEPIAEPLRESLAACTDAEILDAILSSRTCALGALFGWGDLAEALTESVGVPEDVFLANCAVRMTAAARAMEIFVSRLT